MRFLASHFVLPRDKPEHCADFCAVRVAGERAVAVLSDGAGSGAGAREAASRIVEALAACADLKELEDAAKAVGRALHGESLARFGRPEMIATLVAVVVEEGVVRGVSLGDSRAYLVRGGVARQLTRDHTHPQMAHVLTAAMGLSADPMPEAFWGTLEDGDAVVLVSDGVWNASPVPLVLAPDADARALVQAARAVDGQGDDASAVVLRVPEVLSLAAEKLRGLPVPQQLRAGDAVDGLALVRPLDPGERTWVAQKEDGLVVLKFAPAEADDSEVLLDAFIREAWNATALRGEAFVVSRRPEQPSARYYIMDFVDAPTLESVLKTRRLAPDEAAALALFLARACGELLRLDLLHGDIKPENILVTGDPAKPSFRIIDLGSAAPPGSVTTRAGTASFLAPERFHGAAAAERTEIFAIGVTVYRALTGKYPYGEIERFQTPQFSAAKKPSDLNTRTPPWMDALLLRCLSLVPENRYRNFADLAFALSHTAQVESWIPPQAPPPRALVLARRPEFWIVLGILLLVSFFLFSRR